MLKLSFSTLGCPNWTLRQIIDNAAHMGYDAVDFRGLQKTLDITQSWEFTKGLKTTRQMFRDHGIEISGIATSARFAVVGKAELHKQLSETRRNMELAKELDTHILRVYAGQVPEGYNVDSILPTLCKNLLLTAEEAAAFDVTLALETHDDWTDSSVFARLMREVSHPRVRVLWDLHHPFRSRGETPELTYEHLAPYVVSIHVKDSIPAPDGKHQYVPLGEGDVPVKTMLEKLIAGGYSGYAVLEWEKRWIPTLLEPEVVFPQYIKKMREWFGDADD